MLFHRLTSRCRRLFARAAWFALAAGLLVTVCAPGPARAQDTVREVREAANIALGKGDFATAVIHLRQLIEWFKTSDKANTVQDLESLYYNLGLSHFFLGQFEDSRKVLEEYMTRYKRYPRANEVAMYIGDTLRFQEKLDDAIAAYQKAIKSYSYTSDLRADIFASMARCRLAVERWTDAVPFLLEVYRVAPDMQRKNWAASLLTVSWLQVLDVDKVYRVVPFLLVPESFASRSVAVNMTALQAGDALFSDEKYRDALWVYRLVYPYETLKQNSFTYYENLQRQAKRLRKSSRNPRRLMRVQEAIGEAEVEIKAFETVENYDDELFYRIARSYMEIRRYREGGDSFYKLYLDGLKDKEEECLYLSFFCAMQYQPWDKAFQRGLEYMKQYPAKEYYDTVSLSVAQMYAAEKNWKRVIEVLTETLEVSPRHQDIVECLFLLGYACFMEERFGECQGHLTRMNRDYPGNEREADGEYWLGMAYLFDKKYEESLPHFECVVHEFRDSIYVEDASFRSATCDYGLSNFLRAEEKLLAFVGRYTESTLLGEAYIMLGDISGEFGELQEAIRRFSKALEYTLNIELYNHAYFKSGEMLKDLKQYEAIIPHFKKYIELNREDSNLPLAIYWIATAYWELDRKAESLDFYQRAMLEYGDDREALGTDLIFEQWIGRTREAGPDLQREAWRTLRDMLRDALADQKPALALRCEHALLYSPDATDEEKDVLRKTIVQERNLPHASPGVLEYIMDRAEEDKNRDLAMKAAAAIVDTFPETDVAMQARMLAAQDAIDRTNYDEAVAHLTYIREQFATQPEAAEALLLLGDLFMKMRRYDEADQAFKDLLGNKDWKPLWPAGLYGRGENAAAQRKYAEAAAYFERIYVLYSGYRQWAAKAYLARAEALEKMREYQKALETLNEMLASPDFEGMPERTQAEATIRKLKNG